MPGIPLSSDMPWTSPNNSLFDRVASPPQQSSLRTGGSSWEGPRTAAPLESIGVLASLQLEPS